MDKSCFQKFSFVSWYLSAKLEVESIMFVNGKTEELAKSLQRIFISVTVYSIICIDIIRVHSIIA